MKIQIVKLNQIIPHASNVILDFIILLRILNALKLINFVKHTTSQLAFAYHAIVAIHLLMEDVMFKIMLQIPAIT